MADLEHQLRVKRGRFAYGWQLVNQVEKGKQAQERHADHQHGQHHFLVYQATQYVHVSPP